YVKLVTVYPANKSATRHQDGWLRLGEFEMCGAVHTCAERCRLVIVDDDFHRVVQRIICFGCYEAYRAAEFLGGEYGTCNRHFVAHFQVDYLCFVSRYL